MIGLEKLSQVQEMLAAVPPVPKAVIARQLNIGRRTVYDISIGTNRRRSRSQPFKGYARPTRGWCAGCGHDVVLPCLRCSLVNGSAEGA